MLYKGTVERSSESSACGMRSSNKLFTLLSAIFGIASLAISHLRFCAPTRLAEEAALKTNMSWRWIPRCANNVRKWSVDTGNTSTRGRAKGQSQLSNSDLLNSDIHQWYPPHKGWTSGHTVFHHHIHKFLQFTILRVGCLGSISGRSGSLSNNDIAYPPWYPTGVGECKWRTSSLNEWVQDMLSFIVLGLTVRSPPDLLCPFALPCSRHVTFGQARFRLWRKRDHRHIFLSREECWQVDHWSIVRACSFFGSRMFT